VLLTPPRRAYGADIARIIHRRGVDAMAPTLTLSRAAAVLEGLPPSELQGPELTPEALHALRTLLRSHGFDVDRPIYVRELPENRGFRLAQ
jgi:hypothetical protein